MSKQPRLIVHAPRANVGPGAREVEVHGETHALVPLGDAALGPLHWQQPRVFRRVWSLVSDRGEHLLLHGRGFTRRRLAAETPAATWVLTRSWGAEGRELASMQRGWFGRRRLELPSGPTLAWRWRWGGGHVLEDAEGHELLRLQRRFTLFRCQATVSLSDDVRSRKDLLEVLAVTFFAWISAPRGHAH